MTISSRLGSAGGRQEPYPLLGCIADDYTGATDVASAFRRAGLRTVLRFGVPDSEAALPPCDAVVVALKTRSEPPSDAVADSLSTHDWLTDKDVSQVYFKYCSTFDSTDAGNIGVVADALLDARVAALTVVCPAAPDHGRTVYQGHLFVGDRLLSDSPMRHHPLTPMLDSDLVRLLSKQTPHRVSLVPLGVVREGADCLTHELGRLAARGTRYAVTDAIVSEDLDVIAASTASMPVVTGAAGLASSLATNATHIQDSNDEGIQLPPGRSLILAGSCSSATLEQVERAREHMPFLQLQPSAAPDATALADAAITWLGEHAHEPRLLVYSSAPLADRDDRQSVTAGLVEKAMARVARAAVADGFTRLIVAGGETSGAVVQGLDIREGAVAADEAVGVPWIVVGNGSLALLLKSGNFGGSDLFITASSRDRAG